MGNQDVKLNVKMCTHEDIYVHALRLLGEELNALRERFMHGGVEEPVKPSRSRTYVIPPIEIRGSSGHKLNALRPIPPTSCIFSTFPNPHAHATFPNPHASPQDAYIPYMHLTDMHNKNFLENFMHKNQIHNQENQGDCTHG